MSLNTGEAGDIVAGGACPNHMNWDEFFPNFSVFQARGYLFEPGFDAENLNSVAKLTLENRLLHHIVTHCIIQRKGSLGNITDFDIGILACIRQRVKLNLPWMILKQMRNASSRPNKRVYPYSMFLTYYFISFLNLTIGPRDLTPLSIKDSTYCLDTLSRLFVQQDGVWRRRVRRPVNARQAPAMRAWVREGRQRGQDEESDDGDDAADEGMPDHIPDQAIPEVDPTPSQHPHFSQAPHDSYVTHDYFNNAMQGLRTDIFGRFTQMEDHFNTRFDRWDESSGQMSSRVDDIAEMLRRMGGGGSGGDRDPGTF